MSFINYMTYAHECNFNDEFELPKKCIDSYYLGRKIPVSEGVRNKHVEMNNKDLFLYYLDMKLYFLRYLESLDKNKTLLIYTSTIPSKSTNTSPIKSLLNTLPNNNAFTLSKELQIPNYITLYGSCCGGLQAIDLAEKMLNSGQYSNVIIIAVDEINEYFIDLFYRLRLLTNDHFVPFMLNSAGFFLGEGMGILGLSSKRDNAIAKIESISIQCDNSSYMSPSENTLKSILRTLCKNNDYVASIIPHGTGTYDNDRVESSVLDKFIREYSRGLTDIYFYKPYLGHCMCASSLLEIILHLHNIKNNRCGRYALDPSYKDYVRSTINKEYLAIKGTKEYTYPLNTSFIKLAYGMGGVNGGVLIRCI